MTHFHPEGLDTGPAQLVLLKIQKQTFRKIETLSLQGQLAVN